MTTQDPTPQMERSEEYLLGFYDAITAILSSPRVAGVLRSKIQAMGASVYTQIMERRGETPEEIEDSLLKAGY